MGADELLENLRNDRGLKVPSISTTSVQVYFDKKVLDYLGENKAYSERVARDIVKYGYIGGSRGGLNGILLVNPKRDGNLAERLNNFIKNGRCEKLASAYCLDKKNLKGVKVVVHDKSGRRIIGVMDEPNRKIVLYEVSNYKR